MAEPARDRLGRGARDALAASFLVVLTSSFFLDVVFGPGRFYFRDLARFYYPVKHTLARIVASGEFPWWNPFYAAGQPMAANPEYSIFYPLQWLIFIPDFDLGFRLHILVHLYIGVLGTYALLRSGRLGITAALFGAVSWGLGGVVLSNISLLPILFAASWLPLILLGLRRALIGRSIGAIALAGLAGGMQILVAEPTTLLQTWLLAGGGTAWFVYRHERHPGGAIRSVATAGAVFLIAVAIGAVQLIPAMDLAGDTVRGRGLPLHLITYWSFPPARLLELAYPFLLGFLNDAGNQMWWGGALYERANSPFFMNLYGGALLVPLVAAGLSSRGCHRREYLAALTPFLVVALGDFLPFLGWLDGAGIDIPFRFPEKFMLGAVFVSVLYAAFVLDRGMRRSRTLLIRAAAMAAVLLVIAMGFWTVTAAGGAGRYLALWGMESSMFQDRMTELVPRGWMISTAFLATNLVAVLALVHRGAGYLWRTLLIVIVSSELFVVSLDVAPRIHRDLFEEPPIVTELPADADDWRLFHEADWYGQRFFPNGHGVYWEFVNGLHPLTPAAWGYRTVLERDYDLTQLAATVELVESMWEVRNAGQERWAEIFMQMSNARIRVVRADRPPRAIVAEKPWLVEPVEIVDRGPVPRYYFASELRRIDSREELTARLEREVPPERAAFVQDLQEFDPGEGTIDAVRETSSTVTIDTTCSERSFLVLSVTTHKYWSASIDGRDAPLHRTNIAYQGLVVEPGTHTIELRYANPLVRTTAPVSAAFVLLALAGAGHPRLRRHVPRKLAR